MSNILAILTQTPLKVLNPNYSDFYGTFVFNRERLIGMLAATCTCSGSVLHNFN